MVKFMKINFKNIFVIFPIKIRNELKEKFLSLINIYLDSLFIQTKFNCKFPY